MGVLVRVLGPLEVHDGHAPRRIVGTKERMLLALLAARAGDVVSTDTIADALWHEDPPPSAAKGLQVFVARLRKALAAPPAVPVAIEHCGNGYRLTPATAVDVTLAEALLRSGALAAAAGELDQAATTLGRGEQLWRGPSLAEIRDEPVAVATAQRLDELHAELVTERLDVELRRGRHVALVGDLEAACLSHPYRERLWGLRMIALYRSGRTAEALRAFQDARSALAELGLDVGQPLRALEAAILREDPSLRFDGAVAALPTGEVSFVSTGLEGSTASWDRAPAAMAEAVGRHDDLVAGVMARHGGAVVRARGEEGATLSAFAGASHALAAAVDVQRSMLAEAWPDGVGLRMVVAVHTGPALLRDRDYVGPTVNRVARLRDAGHAGQVLLSGATAALVRDRLPDGLSVRHLGERRLRDLRAPEDVFQVEHAELPAAFPPLRTLDPRAHNLPVHSTSFVGREALVETVVARLRSDARLVTLSGPGGVGKTRSAQQTAAELVDDFADGVWFVGLAALSEPDEVPAAVAAVLGVRPTSDRTIAETVVDHLQEHELLLVLDNVEHVLDCATFVADLLAGCPGVRVLATSREWLHLRGEHEVRVEPLAEGDAGTLFLERARLVRLDVDDVVERADVERLCRDLDGMPLAIELVAARLRHLELAEIVEQVGVVLDLAADGPRDQPARQRTLRDTVAWSVDLLDAEERRAFERLSVFHGAFSASDAAAVLRRDANAATLLLVGLADKSLVVQLDDDRFDLLVTLKAYGAELLAAGPDASDTSDAHATHFGRMARRWLEARGGIDEDVFDDVNEPDPVAFAVIADLRAAAAHATATGSPDTGPLICVLVALVQYVNAAEAVRWAELPDLDALAGRDDDADWRYWVGFARLSALWAVGRYTEAEAGAAALLAGPAVPSAKSRSEVWALMGIAQWRLGHLDDAEASLRCSIEAAPDPSSASGLLVHHNLGLVTHSRGDLASAAAQYERGRALASAAGVEEMAAINEMRLAMVLLDRGEWHAAIDLLEGTLDRVVPTTLPLVTGALVEGLIESGDAGAAVDRARQAIERFEGGDPSVRLASWPLQRAALGAALRAAGDLDGARATLEEGLAAAADGVTRADLHRELGLVAEAAGDEAVAARSLSAALAAAGDAPMHLAWLGLADLGRVELARGEVERARRLLVAGLARFASAGHRPAVAQLALALADVAAVTGDIELAALLLGVAAGREHEVGIVARRSLSGGRRAGEAEVGLAAECRRALVAEGRSMALDDLLQRIGGGHLAT